MLGSTAVGADVLIDRSRGVVVLTGRVTYVGRDCVFGATGDEAFSYSSTLPSF